MAETSEHLGGGAESDKSLKWIHGTASPDSF